MSHLSVYNNGLSNIGYDLLHYLVAEHLNHSSPTVAALTLTCRSLANMLHYVKYRSIRLDLQYRANKHDVFEDKESSAERLAKRLQDDPRIIQSVKFLWVGQRKLAYLPALANGVEARAERRSLCYILTRPYSALLEFTLLTRTSDKWGDAAYAPGGHQRPMPAVISASIHQCLTLPSLSKALISVQHLPPSILDLLKQAASLSISGGSNDYPTLYAEFRPSLRRPGALRIEDSQGMKFLRHNLLASLPLNDISIFTARFDDSQYESLSRSFARFSSKLTNLNLFCLSFSSRTDVSLDLSQLPGLRSLTFGCFRPDSGREARHHLASVIAALYSAQRTNMESVTLSFSEHRPTLIPFQCGKSDTDWVLPTCSIREWVYWVDRSLWKDFEAVFISPSTVVQSRWSQLKKVRIVLTFPNMPIHSIEFFRAAMQSRLPNLVKNGLLSVEVERYGNSGWSQDAWLA